MPFTVNSKCFSCKIHWNVSLAVSLSGLTRGRPLNIFNGLPRNHRAKMAKYGLIKVGVVRTKKLKETLNGMVRKTCTTCSKYATPWARQGPRRLGGRPSAQSHRHTLIATLYHKPVVFDVLNVDQARVLSLSYTQTNSMNLTYLFRGLLIKPTRYNTEENWNASIFFCVKQHLSQKCNITSCDKFVIFSVIL